MTNRKKALKENPLKCFNCTHYAIDHETIMTMFGTKRQNGIRVKCKVKGCVCEMKCGL